MTSMSQVPANIDEYIASAAPAARPILKEIRRVCRAAAPEAEEIISYRMPAFRQGGVLIYFAAFRNHIGVFPPVEGDAALRKAVKRYEGPKGNLRFPLDEPIPYDLIGEIVKFRLKQNLAKSKARAKAKSAKAKPAKAKPARAPRPAGTRSTRRKRRTSIRR